MQLRYRNMRSFRLGMLSAGLAVWVLLMGASVSSLRTALAESQPTPASSGGGLLTVQKQIVLRSEQGRPVPGVEVQLAPADPSLGGPVGPEASAEVKRATTDSQGIATFRGLGLWIWMVSFSGAFEGKALQPTQEQGRSPYGRTRAGGGFPVMVQRQEEDIAATPIVVQGAPQPEAQPSLFVLIPVQDLWVPSLDLALPGERPQPVSGAVTAQPAASPAADAVSATHTDMQDPATNTFTAADGGFDTLVRWLYILPVAVALVAFYRAWQERKQASSQHRSRADVSDDSLDSLDVLEDQR